MSSFQRSSRFRFASMFAVCLVGFLALGCNSPMAPNAPASPQFQLTNALIEVNGEVVNGESFQTGQMNGTSTFFQATLMGANGPVSGQAVQVQYQIPHQGPGGMMNGPGEGFMTLYDDGTHGDRTPGDGIYCYDDQQGQYGMHMQGAPAGTYHYEFFGVDHTQHHTNHMNVDVTIMSNATATSLHLSGAQVMVGGNIVNGQTIHMGQMTGNSTFFQAMLTGPHGAALGESVQVHYEIPHPGMMGGGAGEGYLHLYDNGTHGDPVAGDGIYCYDDQQGEYGLHMHGAPAGTYHYEFFGVDHTQHHTNHMSVNVMLVQQ